LTDRAARSGSAAAVFWFLLALYLATYSPRFHSSDGLAMFSMAESLARRGEADIDQIQWMGLQQGTYGLDGHLYSRKGAGMSLLEVPLVVLGLVVPAWGAATTALLLNSLVTAATAAVVVLAVRRLDFSDRVALATGLTFGVATLAWPYAKTCFSDPLAGICLSGAALALLHFRQTQKPLTAGWAGAALAVAVVTRYANIALVPLFGGVLLWTVWKAAEPAGGAGRAARLWRAAGAFCLPLILTGVLVAWYNLGRYGNPLDTGYLPEESFNGVWAEGIAGLLVSPGRGLFLYAPVLLLALPALPTFARKYRVEAILFGGVVLIHVLLYGKWFMWHGGYAWGPRFMVPSLPFLVILMAPVLAWTAHSLRWRTAAWVMASISGLVQIEGLSVHFELFQNHLLDGGLALYAPVTFFDPRYSPLAGQLRFITPANLDFAWIRDGQVDGVLLAGLLAALSVTGWGLARAIRGIPACRFVVSGIAVPVMVVGAAAWLLTSAHAGWPYELRQAIATLNERTGPDDAVIVGRPEEAAAFADLYKGRARVLGVNPGTLGEDRQADRALAKITTASTDVWVLPNWLPPEKNGIEQRLMSGGFRAEERVFRRGDASGQGQRLVLYYFPPQPLTLTSLEAGFGDNITLERAGAASLAKRGGVLPVVLYWRTARPIAADYHVFVQLLDGEGTRVAGSDGEPALGTRPTTGWQPGEVVQDRHGLMLPADLPPAEYRLIAGLYLPDSGERLPAVLGTFAPIGVVQVGP
jgi:hypothetical protein